MLKGILKNELVKGSLILFILFNIFNFLNFVFQISMARMLHSVQFGVLATLTILIYFAAIPSDGIQLLASKYTSRFNSHREIGKIKYFLYKVFTKGIKLSILIFIVFIPIFYLLSIILDISFVLFLLIGTTIFAIFLVPTIRGTLQGMKKFNALGINMIIEGVIKVGLSVFLVYLGWQIYGAVIGIIVGTFIPFLIAFIPLKEVIREEKEKADVSKIYEYSSPIIFVLLAIMAFQSIDILLANIFFTSDVVGKYAVTNQIGKMIFFGTLAISRVMFPISSEKFGNKIKTKSVLTKSLMIVFILCLISVIVLLLFPKIVVSLLYGAEYISISGIVFNIGIAFSFLSLSNLILLYGISIDKQIKFWHVLIFLIAQTVLLSIFSKTIYLYSIGMIVSGIILFIGSLFIIRSKD